MFEYIKNNDWKVIKVLLIISCLPYPILLVPTIMSLGAMGQEKNIFIIILGSIAWGLVLVYPVVEIFLYKYAKHKLFPNNKALAYSVALWPYSLGLIMLVFGYIATLI